MNNRRNILKNNNNIFTKIKRYYFVLAFFIFVFIYIIITIFNYTITDHEFYKEEADKQQILEVKIPITRGAIYSGNNEGITFATSVNLNDLAIDPTQPGNKEKLILFLTDVIYEENCNFNLNEECLKNTLKFLKLDEIIDFQYDEEYIKGLIKNKLLEYISQKYITSVLIADELDEEIISKLGEVFGIKPNYKYKGIEIKESSIYINPEELENKKLIAKKMSSILSYSEEDLLYSFRRRKKQYINLLKKLSINVSSELEEFLEDEKNAIKKGYLKKENSISSFIRLSPQPHRFYPENSIGSQVLGYVDKKGKGYYGIEGYFDEILEGESKQITIKKDIKGRIVNPIDLKKDFIEREGAAIYTTIDRNVQKKVEKILELGVKKYNANKGSVIIMNPNNGKIISMANYPTFNPNDYGEVYELEKVKNSKYKDVANELIGKEVFIEDKIDGDKYYFDNDIIFLRKATREELADLNLKKYKYKNDFGENVYKNSIITDIYEPGSIMKSFTMAIGIDSGEITKNSSYQNNGPIKIDQFPISDVSRDCLGYHTFSYALNYSCNVGMVRVIQKVGKALLYNYLVNFGFGRKTDITLDGEISLSMDNYEKWSNAKLYTMSYGLGINVNQLQMAVAYSSLVNGGLVLKPQIIDKIDFLNEKQISFKTEIINRVITKKTSDIMIDLLVDSIENGVAKHGKVDGYLLGGKTGTSQIAYKGGYEDGNMPGSTNASFAGFGPAQDPQFVVIVKLERPRTNNYGGETSSFIFSDISKYLLEYYKIPKIK